MRTLLSPDSATGGAVTNHPVRTKAAKARPVAAAADSKESEAEEIVHELFRLCSVDLRSSPHGIKLAKRFGALVHKGGSHA